MAEVKDKYWQVPWKFPMDLDSLLLSLNWELGTRKKPLVKKAELVAFLETQYTPPITPPIGRTAANLAAHHFFDWL